MPGWPPCWPEESLFLDPKRFNSDDSLWSGCWVGAVKAADEAAVRRRAVLKSFVMVAFVLK